MGAGEGSLVEDRRGMGQSDAWIEDRCGMGQSDAWIEDRRGMGPSDAWIEDRGVCVLSRILNILGWREGRDRGGRDGGGDSHKSSALINIPERV